jgi:hypothetical protein
VNELLGSDYSEHNILHSGIGIEKAVDVLKAFHHIQTNLDPTGNNLGKRVWDQHGSITRLMALPIQSISCCIF